MKESKWNKPNLIQFFILCTDATHFCLLQTAPSHSAHWQFLRDESQHTSQIWSGITCLALHLSCSNLTIHRSVDLPPLTSFMEQVGTGSCALADKSDKDSRTSMDERFFGASNADIKRIAEWAWHRGTAGLALLPPAISHRSSSDYGPNVSDKHTQMLRTVFQVFQVFLALQSNLQLREQDCYKNSRISTHERSGHGGTNVSNVAECTRWKKTKEFLF